MPIRIALVGALACVLCLGGCEGKPSAPASAPATAPSTQPAIARPGPIPGVGNFAQVSDVLYRGEQPTAEGFAQLKKMGIKTVISLRAVHSDRSLLAGTGLRYVRIECVAWHPEDEDIAAALKIIQDPANQPVFIHCQHGSDRTGFAVAAYRIVEEGWPAERAEAEMRNFGLHESYFPQITPFVRGIDAAKMRELIRKTRLPKVDTVK